jgi:pyridoxine 5-phosphate synthase
MGKGHALQKIHRRSETTGGSYVDGGVKVQRSRVQSSFRWNFFSMLKTHFNWQNFEPLNFSTLNFQTCLRHPDEKQETHNLQTPMTKLSVNINKFATLRNSRGGDNPDVVKAAKDAQAFGADGVTVHPRPDERHIRYADVRAIKPVIITEFNIEGNCREQKFIDLVLEIKPHQVTLVPDTEGQLTSDHGWDTHRHQAYLKETIQLFKNAGIRVSIFVDPVVEMIEGAAKAGTDRVELYTEAYAKQYARDSEAAVKPYLDAAKRAKELGIGLNAGHDLDLNNLAFLKKSIPWLDEVSIGHALICDSLYYGFENTIQMYRRALVLGGDS